jgi:hypothetical protein
MIENLRKKSLEENVTAEFTAHTKERWNYSFGNLPITMVVRSKARTVFAPSNAGIVGANPARGMDVCARFFFLCLCCSVCR